MFSSSAEIDRKRWRFALGVSLVLHGCLIYLAMRRPAPAFVKLSAVRAGERGTSLLPVYLPRRQSEDALELKKEAATRPKVLEFLPVQSRPQKRDDLRAADQPKAQTAEPSRGASAGSAYGSMWEGNAIGAEVKPALPIFGPQPAVPPSDLPPGLEGNVIVEVTIDEQGMVVNEILLHGLGRGIDQKVLEVLENWRFKPATKDGVAIASKQDVYFHFRGA